MALETCIATIARSMNKIDVSKYTVVDAGNIMMDALEKFMQDKMSESRRQAKTVLLAASKLRASTLLTTTMWVGRVP